MNDLRVNNKPAVRIKARFIRSFTRGDKKSYLFDCEGDEVWLPWQCVKIEEGEGTILIEEWLYNKKVQEGIL